MTEICSKAKIDRFLADRETDRPTPFLVVDLDMVAEKFRHMRAAFADADIYYAVKANSGAPVLERLAGLGCGFDVASLAEARSALATRTPPGRLSYGNTIKKEADIARASALGLDLFAFDCEAELAKIGRAAPGARVFCRIARDNDGARWPLAGKFGCDEDEAVRLMAAAADHGLKPEGLSFHVGSQQTEPRRWSEAIQAAGAVCRSLRALGIEIDMLNMGGGFPVAYMDPVPGLDEIAVFIENELSRAFPNRRPRIAFEPGRILVAEAGVIRSSVVLVADRGKAGPRGGFESVRWVYLDIGRFSGLAETHGEAIRYRLVCAHDGGQAAPVKIAGPTCDGQDILYEHSAYELPLALGAEDTIDILAAGAYTTAYSTTGFNGFPPLETYYI